MTNNNIKNNKTRTVTAIIATMGVMFVLLTPTTILPFVNAQAENSCDQSIAEQMRVIGKNVDNKAATALANSSSEVQAELNGHNYTFNSIYTIGSFGIDCKVALDSVNVVFSLHDTKGEFKNIVVTEDPSLSKIVTVSEQTPIPLSTSTNTWAGYELSGNSQASASVYQVSAGWTQTTVSVPKSSYHPTEPTCNSPLCSTAMWIGLEDATLGSLDEAQAGTLGEINCGFTGCPTSYGAEYEFLPSGPVSCSGSSYNIVPGNSISTTVTNEAQYGGSSTLYDISVTDNSIGKTCGTTGYSYTAMNAPTYGAFILERAGSPSTSLANYTSNTFGSGTIYYGGSSNGISTPYGNGWYQEDVMNNGCSYGDNVDPTSISSNSFSETYHDSCGT